MERQLNHGIVLRNLLSDPLLKRYSAFRIDEALFREQLKDPRLFHRQEDELLELSDEELISWILPPSLLPTAEEEQPPPSGDFPVPLDGEGDQRVSVIVEELGTAAKIVLSAPSDGEEPLTLEDLQQALSAHGIAQGVQTEFLLRLSERPVYGRKFKIAAGTLPVDGVDGSVDYRFDPSPNLTPKLREDDTVDYKSLDFAKSVREGEILCEITPPTRGRDGINVFGDVLPGRNGKPCDLLCGANTAFSEDKRQIVATCDGRVALRGNKVVVSKVLMVDQVGPATGNILFAGTVQVAGEVKGGFTVRAGGDIIVKGIVEDAALIAGGNIVLCGGMKGHDRGRLEANGSIRALFLENTRIRCLKSLYADVLLNCTTECGETVSLSGKNGSLLGGSCTAGASVRALSIGNEAHIETRICLREIGTAEKRRLQRELEISRRCEAMERLGALADAAAGTGVGEEAFPAMLARIIITKHRLQNSIRLLEEELAHGVNGQISRAVIVREALCPNVSIEIDGVRFRTTALRYQCFAQRVRDRIVVRSGHYY